MWHFLGWIFVTIIVPVLAPVVIQWGLYKTEHNEAMKMRLRPINAVKDGQLLLVTTALVAIAFNELPSLNGFDGFLGAMLGLILAVTIFLLVRGAGRSSEVPEEDGSKLIIMKVSIILTFVTSIFCIGIHLMKNYFN